MQVIRLLVIVFSVIGLFACSSVTPTPSEKYKSLSAEQLFTRAEQQTLKGSYRQAIEYYEALDAMYPFSQYAEQGQLGAIYAYYKSDDYLSAASAADHFIRLYPRSKKVDYAYYIKGVSNFEQDRGFLQRLFHADPSLRDVNYAHQAFANLNELVKRFPNSSYVADANQRLIYLRNMLARHEIHVANYYMKRYAYVAASNRASYVIDHYQGADVMPDALSILAKANRELKIPKLADEAERTLKKNFPNYQG